MYNAITGLFEIHVSVNPSQQWEHRLFCLEHKLKPLFTCEKYGENRNQLMISKWKNGTGSEAIAKANEIAAEMSAAGLEVVRVKVEAMAHNEGVPI